MRRRHLLATLGLTCSLGLAAFGPAQAQAPDWKKIRLGVEGAYPPFSEVGPDGQLKGFDIDIALALCAQLQAQCTLVPQEWDGLIPGLQARKFDAIIASMSITPERQKVVNFTHKYYSTPARLVAKANAGLQATAEGLKGKKIGVQRATIHDRYVSDHFKQSQVVRYAKADELVLDLVAGRLDVVMADAVALDGSLLKKPAGKAFAFFGPAYTDTQYFGVGAGIAVRKADVGLQTKLNSAIAAIRADGRYKAIQDKYFDFDIYGQ